MKSYCLKCKIENQNIRRKVSNTSDDETMLLSNCAKCGEVKGILSNWGIRTPLSKIPLLDNIFLKFYKMNEIVNKFSLAGNKFMPEKHLKRPWFTYSVFASFT